MKNHLELVYYCDCPSFLSRSWTSNKYAHKSSPASYPSFLCVPTTSEYDHPCPCPLDAAINASSSPKCRVFDHARDCLALNSRVQELNGQTYGILVAEAEAGPVKC